MEINFNFLLDAIVMCGFVLDVAVAVAVLPLDDDDDDVGCNSDGKVSTRYLNR